MTPEQGSDTMGEANDFGAGWSMPVLGVASRKAHYYTAGFRGASLCGKYALLGGIREDYGHDSPDNCAACARKYYATQPELELPRRWRRVSVEFTEEVRHPEYDYVIISAGRRGVVKGLTVDSLKRLASQGGKVDAETTRPIRRVFVRADSLKVLHA